jgi:bifunctional non-homologous end joining protein LigD
VSLREYHRKRHFAKTPEPQGTEAKMSGRSFVVQKHDASHLHYDFRLEDHGVLKSWAIPKGPHLDPSVKRLAMEVEDHPVEYGSFEGIIPQGEYGGGTVMLWDRGTWEPIGDAKEGFRTGRLKFKLFGEKLHGAWMLVRTNRGDEKRQQWLLFKERDEFAKSGRRGDITASETLSVATGRDLDSIAADQDDVWSTNRKSPGKAKTQPRENATDKKAKKSAPLPKRINVQLATLVKEPPPGDEWIHEVKFDGYRIVCRIDGDIVQLFTRRHNDWTHRMPELVESLRRLDVQSAIIDGEAVVLRPDGTTDFQDLQNAFKGSGAAMDYFAFDLLHLNGVDLTQWPLADRKARLATLLEAHRIPRVHFSDHIEGQARDFLKKGCAVKLEGIISKRRDSAYTPGRGFDWLKIKCIQTGEFVVGGYTEPSGSRTGLGALLVGVHDDAGKLRYAGKVGTGFDDATLTDLRKRLRPLERDDSPFADRKRAPGKTHWVEPKLVAQIVYGSKTHEGILRHSSFQGLREDKSADEVTRDEPTPLKTALRQGGHTGRRPSVAPSVNRVTAKSRRAGSATSANDDYDKSAETFRGHRLTSPEKILEPQGKITKLDLARYYAAIADWILPHMNDRPLVLVRCPEGRQKSCFYQKHPAAGTPEALRQIPVREKTKTENYVIADDLAGLIGLAQIGALELHAWGSRADKLELPDRLIFDLDPDPKVDWADVVHAAHEIREFLSQLELESFVKTTGGKGLHLVVPLLRRHAWDEVKEFCKNVAEAISAAAPDRFTANMSKAARHGKIFIDYLRNGRGATAVLPYSPRSRPGMTVSAPLAWEELTAKMHSDQFDIRTILDRVRSLRRDPWQGIFRLRQGLATPMKRLRMLMTGED